MNMKRTVFCLIGGLLLVCGAQAQAATATFLGSCTSGTSHACQFDASGSSCPGSSILTYSWSFGDASASLGGSLMNHTYTAPLSSYYKVDLLVYCADGSQATASRYVCVNIGFWGCIVPNRGWN